MLEKNKKGEIQVRTAHSLNKVPLIIYDRDNTYTILEGEYGLANVAPTVASLLGLKAPECWEKSMIYSACLSPGLNFLVAERANS